jgi:hypothetical protein
VTAGLLPAIHAALPQRPVCIGVDRHNGLQTQGFSPLLAACGRLVRRSRWMAGKAGHDAYKTRPRISPIFRILRSIAEALSALWAHDPHPVLLPTLRPAQREKGTRHMNAEVIQRVHAAGPRDAQGVELLSGVSTAVSIRAQRRNKLHSVESRRWRGSQTRRESVPHAIPANRPTAASKSMVPV